MRILSLDAEVARAITAWDSTGVRNLPVLRSSTGGATDLLHFAAGSHLGRHAAGWAQLFLVADGTGWVSGSNGVRRRITAGQAAYWEPGEQHESGSETGMTAFIVQAAHPDALAVPGAASPPPTATGEPSRATGRPSPSTAQPGPGTARTRPTSGR